MTTPASLQLPALRQRHAEVKSRCDNWPRRPGGTDWGRLQALGELRQIEQQIRQAEREAGS